MTQRDKWKKRPVVVKYRAFKDTIRYKLKAMGLETMDLNNGGVRFVVPMPKSWSLKKRGEMNGQPHTQKPDIDNFLKALLDALYTEDSHIHTITVQKVWGVEGEIQIVLEDEAEQRIQSVCEATEARRMAVVTG